MTFKGYKVKWCNLCGIAKIRCRECGTGSCSGNSCEKCSQDFDEFHKISNTILQSDIPSENKNVSEEMLIVGNVFGE